MSILMEFSVFPLDQGESVGRFVTEVVRMLDASGVHYRLTAMGTIVETAEVGQALALVERAYQVLAEQGCHRVYATAKLDIRPGREGRITGKVESVRARLGATTVDTSGQPLGSGGHAGDDG